MSKVKQIILGIIFTFLVLMLSGMLGVELKTMIDYFPDGFFNQIIILLFSSILIYIFNKKGIIDFNIARIKTEQIILPISLTVLLLEAFE